MAQIHLSELLNTISRFSPSETHVIEAQDENGVHRFKLYTDTNEYAVSLSERYMGCVAKARKPRAGENWQRGNDLRDGPPTMETWLKILGDIVSYEMQRVHRPAYEAVGSILNEQKSA